MKKLYLLGLVLLSMSAMTFAGFETAENLAGAGVHIAGSAPTDMCEISLSAKDYDAMQRLADFLYTRADLLETRFPGTTSMTYQFADQIYNSLEEDCYGIYFANYKEFQTAFSAYIANLISGNVPQVADFEADDEAAKAILQLQQHVIDLLSMDFDWTKPFASTSDMTIAIDVAMAEEDSNTDVHAELNLKADGEYDMPNSLFDTNIDLNAVVAVDMQDPIMDMIADANISANLDILQKDNIYAKVNELTVDVNSDQMDAQDKLQVDMMNLMIDNVLTEIQGKYINITEDLEDAISEFNPNMIMKPYTLFQDISSDPIMDFYKEGDLRYGKLNNNICSISQKIGLEDISDCQDMIYDLDLETEGKGYLLLQKNGTEYSL